MPAAVRRFGRETLIKRESVVEAVDEISCFQAREQLDSLFDGDLLLEEMNEAVRKILFRHLEACQGCCRSFDVRARFRPGGRRWIF